MIQYLYLGRVGYQEGLGLQAEIGALVAAGRLSKVLLLLEHPAVLTLGRNGNRANVLASDDLLAARRIALHAINRGGDVTYHGPGQLVGYPILKLSEDERDLHGYLRNLEEALIGVCADVGLEGRRNPGWTGAWIGARKVASLGIAVRRWVTLHGFALNVATDLSRFTTINPCGLESAVMTSLAVETGRPLTLADVKPLAVAQLGRTLGRDFVLTR